MFVEHLKTNDKISHSLQVSTAIQLPMTVVSEFLLLYLVLHPPAIKLFLRKKK